MIDLDVRSSETPRVLGYRMPAEWEPHEATWLSWPHKEESWPGAFAPVPRVFVEIARELSRSELVRINVASEEMAGSVRQLLSTAGVDLNAIRFHLNPTNDAWARDHGPMYVVRGAGPSRERAIIDWGYNAWGNKYPPYDLDDVVPTRIARESGERLFIPGIVMEGGSIDLNGLGTLLTTESCLLNPNRNPHLTRDEIESYLREYLNVNNILWLGDGIEGDDTDGHIDDLTRFVSARALVTVIEEDPEDNNYHPLRENRARLKEMRDQDGNPFEIVELPMPGARYIDEQRLPQSYANFYIANRSVLVPTFRDANDALALQILSGVFSDRRVVGIDCYDLVWGLGTIHCVTQQQPLV